MATSNSENMQEFCDLLKYGDESCAKKSSDEKSLTSSSTSTSSEPESEQESVNPLSVVFKDFIMGERADFADREYYLLLIIVRNIIKIWFTVFMVAILVSAGGCPR